MQQQGANLVKHYRDLAFMGFLEVVKNLKTILTNIAFCKKDILEFKPDALVLIDYPGFNLRIAAFAKKHKIKVIYYISPQIWAWKESRIHQIKRDVDKMMVILPFEKNYYQQFNYLVQYVGHPLLDALQSKIYSHTHSDFISKYNLPDKPIIALLPGSRKQEIQKMLSIFIKLVPIFKEYQFVIAGAPSIPSAFYQNITHNQITIIENDSYSVLKVASAAIITSGTATLESALLKTPLVVCYKAGSVSYHIAKHLVKIKFISLVNLIADKEVVKELIQHDCTSNKIASELNNMLHNNTYRNNMLHEFDQISELLHAKSGASENASNIILNTITS
jgi:lipid-A-disaccharide synthase